ncbi:MAG: 30S ribosomal protein S6 [Chitinivibrionia bacterium]|nr:30S ribosomal protein S6 [Chitinivibrionia bacterium]
MYNYECIVILSPDSAETAAKNSSQKYAGVIVSGGGEITKMEDWGRRRLAYEINKQSEGCYILYGFRAANAVLTELDRQLRLDETVLRHLIVRDVLATGTEAKIAIEGIQEGEVLNKEEG